MNCAQCEAPQRRLYAPGHRPALTRLQDGNWITLERCEACGALWCASLYEPYAAFEYVARWEASEAEWLEQHAADGGRSLLRWHAAQVRDHWAALPAPEREKVEQHRRRSQGHNPIDAPAVFGLGK